jgi:hypothetical protein
MIGDLARSPLLRPTGWPLSYGTHVRSPPPGAGYIDELVETYLSLCVGARLLSVLPDEYQPSAGQAAPKAWRSTSTMARCCCGAATAKASRDTVRTPAAVLPSDSSARPPTEIRVSSIVSVPASRSSESRRTPSSSERRIPVVAARWLVGRCVAAGWVVGAGCGAGLGAAVVRWGSW